MKKRLLITSIVMMLVVAVALSTATYAWFTSNAKVDMGTMTLKAATSDADAIGIGWLNNEASTSIDSDLFDVLKPMAPQELTVGSTTSTVAFRNATTKEEDSQIQFNADAVTVTYTQVSSLKVNSEYENNSPYYVNDNGTPRAKAGVSYYTASGKLFPTAVTVSQTLSESTNVEELYVRNFAPITYSKKINSVEVGAFYVKNLSTANEINRIDVFANFETGSQAYGKTHDSVFIAGKTYYTRSGASAPYTYTANTVFVDDPENEYDQPAQGQPVAGAAIVGDYYEVLDGNDLIRVALFIKPQSSGTSSATDYTLLGVLGNEATYFTAVNYGTFNKNEVYYAVTEVAVPNVANIDTYYEKTETYALTGDVALNPTKTYYTTSDNEVYTEVNEPVVGNIGTYYEKTVTYNKTADTALAGGGKKYYTLAQDKNVDGTSFAIDGSFCTATNTVAFGDGTAFAEGAAVKDLNYYTDVRTSLTLVEHLQTEKQVDIVALAWLDGTLLDDDHAGVLGQVSLYFKTV